MDERDEVLDALWIAALAGDKQAIAFLHMFGPWALQRDPSGREEEGASLPEGVAPLQPRGRR